MKKLWTVLINVFLWVFFALSSLVFFILALLVRGLTGPFDPNRRIHQKYSCFWASMYIWVNPFWKATIKGLERVNRNKAYVMVANHASLADILVVFRSFLHFKWVAKKSLFKGPLIGWNMWLNGYVPIERGDAKSRDECLEKCRRWLEKGSSVFFFPEGTRSKDGSIKPFKVGAFLLACQTGTDILPIVIRGSGDAIPKHSLLVSRKSHMTLEVLPPVPVEKVPPAQVADAAKQKAEQVHALIAAAR